MLHRIAALRVHRETYIAIINSALARRGDKRSLADKLGIKPQHLSNMLNEYLPDESCTRTPSPELARRLVQLLPAERELRDGLREHLQLAWDEQHGSIDPYFQERPLTYWLIRDLLSDIGGYHVEATNTLDPKEASHKYRVIRDACSLAVRRVDLDLTRMGAKDSGVSAGPLEFAQLCLFLHDVQCVLDRADDALAHAKYAYEILACVEPSHVPGRRDYLDNLIVNSVVAECLAYRNLNLHRKAYEVSHKAESLVRDLGSKEATRWLPHIYLHRLKALSETPRFTLAEIRQLVWQTTRSYVGESGGSEDRWNLNLSEAEARGYLNYGVQNNSRSPLKRARQLLEEPVRRLEHEPVLGPVHTVVLLKTYASVQHALGDLAGWHHYIRLALATALDGGLKHQLKEATQQYGGKIEPLIRELEESRRTSGSLLPPRQ